MNNSKPAAVAKASATAPTRTRPDLVSELFERLPAVVRLSADGLRSGDVEQILEPFGLRVRYEFLCVCAEDDSAAMNMAPIAQTYDREQDNFQYELYCIGPCDLLGLIFCEEFVIFAIL